MSGTYKIGTRGSKLALWQAEYVRSLLKNCHADSQFEIVIIKTTGDVLSQSQEIRNTIDSKNVFVKEIEGALKSKTIDIAVHSLKDMNSTIAVDLPITAYVGGAQRGDVLIAQSNCAFSDLPQAACIGTSSNRRTAQLKLLRDDLKMMPICGNVDTRIRKVNEGAYDAIIVAHAGVERLGLADAISHAFSTEEIIPAAGQGIIAVQTRCDDVLLAEKVKKINDGSSEIVARIEFEFMRLIGADCSVPLGVFAEKKDAVIVVNVFLSSLDCRFYIKFKKDYALSDLTVISQLVINETKERWKKQTGKELRINEIT